MIELEKDFYAGTAQPSSGGGVASVNGQTGAVTLDADDVLPSQTGNSGKFITTDGTNASWGTINALQNDTTSVNSVNIVPLAGGPSVINDNNVLIHSMLTNINNTNSVGINTPYGGIASNSVCINGNNAQGSNSVSIGYGSQAYDSYSVAVGAFAQANGQRDTAIGYNAQIGIGINDVIQLGYSNFGVAQTPTSFYVGFNGYTNYKLLDGTTGLIPAERHASLPASDGTYTLKLTISGGVPTLSWVAD